MKTLKFTLIVAVIFASLTSCTKQDLSEDEVLIDKTAVNRTKGALQD
jgi:hypothetical protein